MRALTSRPFALATIVALLTLAPTVGAQSTAGCDTTAIAAQLTSAQRQLVVRAIQDPIVGCAAATAQHRSGDVTVAGTDTLRGNIVVVDGTLRVAGVVTGTAIALNGAVVIDSGAHVIGNVISAEHGAAIAPFGRVDGELRTLDAVEPTAAFTATSVVGGTMNSLKKTAAFFGILIVLAIGVLTNAGDAMQRVNTALNSGFGRNVVVGLLAQLALLPVLVTICLLLALTLLGVLLIPFAVVAYMIAVLGLVVLGGLGAIQMIGSGIAARRAGLTDRGARLQAVVSGMLLVSIPWLLAAALASRPELAVWVRTLAIGVTWVAVTAGLGAALRTRGGTRAHSDPWGIRRPAPSGAALPLEPPAAEWLTPTPLTGVVAARRPTTGSGSTR